MEGQRFTRAQAAKHPCPKCRAEGEYIQFGKYRCCNTHCRVYYPAEYRYLLVSGSDNVEKVAVAYGVGKHSVHMVKDAVETGHPSML